MTLLRLSRLSASLSGRVVLDAVDLAVRPGECVGLIGPNGAGKSTLMRAALGLIPAAGERWLGDAPVGLLDARARGRRAAWLPQDREIAWPVTVRVLAGLGRAALRTGPETAADHAAVQGALARMDLSALADRPATALSGGERARALVARVLAQEAPLILADEPAAGLDPAHQIGLMQTFAALAGEGRGVLASLHDLGLAARWCDRLVLIDQGRIVADGPPGAVLTADLLAAVYGIRAFAAETPEGLVLQPVARLPRCR
jgi:iron complex transport system ATP-binding protein